MQRRTKILLFFGAAISFLGICLFLFFHHPAKFLEVDFLDVGQGDSELIKTPYGQNVLIDGGPDNKVLAGLGHNLPWLERKIDLIILTHPHDDHVSGLIDVLKKYRVGKILLAASPGNAPPYEEFLRLKNEKNIPTVLVAGRQTVTLGPDLRLQVIYPEKGDIGADLNEDSIVARLVYKDKIFLFTGDAGAKTEEKLLAEKINLRADVLKVGHHGSETSSSLDFLRAVAPQFAVIEAGADNQFGFPKADALWRLKKVGAEIFRTDLDGTVKIRSNGEKIELKIKN